MIREPIWTTWPKYKEAIDDKTINEFAQSIKSHGYKGQIEIDADWEVSITNLFIYNKIILKMHKEINYIKLR